MTNISSVMCICLFSIHVQSHVFLCTKKNIKFRNLEMNWIWELIFWVDVVLEDGKKLIFSILSFELSWIRLEIMQTNFVYTRVSIYGFRIYLFSRYVKLFNLMKMNSWIKKIIFFIFFLYIIEFHCTKEF